MFRLGMFFPKKVWIKRHSLSEEGMVWSLFVMNIWETSAEAAHCLSTALNYQTCLRNQRLYIIIWYVLFSLPLLCFQWFRPFRLVWWEYSQHIRLLVCDPHAVPPANTHWCWQHRPDFSLCQSTRHLMPPCRLARTQRKRCWRDWIRNRWSNAATFHPSSGGCEASLSFSLDLQASVLCDWMSFWDNA